MKMGDLKYNDPFRNNQLVKIGDDSDGDESIYVGEYNGI